MGTSRAVSVKMNSRPIVSIVDDDEGVRTSLGLLIDNADLEVKTYDSAEAFLDKHLENPPQCLLLDVDLPGKSGLDLLEEITTRRLNFPVIMISGSVDPVTPIRAERLGATDYFAKPFDALNLLHRVKQVLESHSPTMATCT